MTGKGGKGGRVKDVNKVLCEEYSIVVKDDDKGIGCSGCDKWYHIKCAEIDHKLYQAMLKFDSDKTKSSGLY